jgi:Superinfection immunity protein
MAIYFNCPHCNTILSTSTGRPGSVLTCKSCQMGVIVPPLTLPPTVPVSNPSFRVTGGPLPNQNPQGGVPLRTYLLSALIAAKAPLARFWRLLISGVCSRQALIVASVVLLLTFFGWIVFSLVNQPGNPGKEQIALVNSFVDAISSIWMVLVVIAIGVAFYMLPTIIALSRGHHNTLAIAVLNILTGWSFIGWVIALVWACTEVRS